MIDHTAAYSAITARDARFDGVFFTGVTSTKIYCRPICPAQTPRRRNCRFFGTAAAAEKAGFRPCLRCRPELAPGSAPVDDGRRIAQLLTERLTKGVIEEGMGLEEIAAQFELSSRQLRRIIQKELGVSPVELLQTRRLLLAKQLLTETTLPVTEIAFASGFGSLRRFNSAFLQHYRMPPTRLRREASTKGATIDASDTSKLQLTYRPPYAWSAILDFLRARRIEGVEHVGDDFYARTIRIGKARGWIKVGHRAEKHALRVEFTHSLTPVLPVVLARLRGLFDLDARPDVIAAHLQKDKRLTGSVSRNPGLRVPGCFDDFEMAVRAILGQQITVKAATTIACRFAAAFGEPIATPFQDLNRLSPTAEHIAKLDIDAIAHLGIISARAKSILALAKAYRKGTLRLDGGMDPNAVIGVLTELPGIGQWTAHYIAMRGLRWLDAFPKEDIAIRNALGRVTPKDAAAIAEIWRPWRSYAVIHLWHSPH